MRSFPNENQVVYVIVLNYNGWWDTIECLESVLKSDYPNLGFAGANNIALKWILKERPGSFVFLLNPDMIVEPDTISRFVELVGPDKGNVYGCRVNDYDAPGNTLFFGGGILNPYTGNASYVKDMKKIVDIDYICGGSFFTCVDNFEVVGLLPEEYFLYWEEVDWCTHAKSLGIRLKVCTTALCYDKVSTSIGQGYLSEYYYTCSSLKYFRKYRPEQIKYILASNLLRMLHRALRLRFAKVKAIMDALGDGMRD